MSADYEAGRKSMYEDFTCFFSLGPIDYFTEGAKKFRESWVRDSITGNWVKLKGGEIETQDTTKERR
jgi:hypothetical protein